MPFVLDHVRLLLSLLLLTLCDQDLNLVSNTWSAIRSRVVRMITQLEEVAEASYQIKSDVAIEAVRKVFDRNV